MNLKEKLDLYVSDLHSLAIQNYIPNDTGEYHFPDPDFLDKVVWNIIISPLSGIIVARLYDRLENFFSYKDAQERLHPDDMKTLAETIAKLINSNDDYYDVVCDEVKHSLQIEESKLFSLKSQIRTLVEIFREVKKILVLSSNPTNTSRLQLDKEIREIDESLRRANKRSEFKIDQRQAVRAEDLRRALLDVEPNIVHFSGHGTEIAGIVLEDEHGYARLVSIEALASLFKLCATHVECVFLNACYSATQADAIAEHIDYVIGMNQAIGDAAAIKFSMGFYDALGAGKSIETAFEFGCNAIQLEGIPEYLTPKIQRRNGVEKK
jgi:hypothetical protein